MSLSTSPARKSFKRPLAIVSGILGFAAAAAAIASTVSPAVAADIAAQPDTQVAVFMVPVTLLILAMMFEVGRSVWRNHIPSSAPARRRVALSTGNTPRAGR